jgi:hypothetical protein
MRREQLDDDDLRLILWEVEAGECPMWKSTVGCSPIHELLVSVKLSGSERRCVGVSLGVS